MSILGKVLAVLNVLAAGAFVYLAAADWSRRQNWEYATFRQELINRGLPLDDEEIDADGVKWSERISDATLKDMFKGIEGPPVKTQLAELDRVRNDVKNQVNNQDGEALKRKKLAELWLPLLHAPFGGMKEGDEKAAEKQLVEDRENLRRRIEKEPLDTLLAQFDKVIQAKEIPGNGPDAPSKGPRSPQQMKNQIAHLLFNLAPEENAHKRLVVVVGWPAFSLAADSQAKLYQELTQAVNLARMKNRADFEVLHRQKFDSIKDQADHVDGLKQFLTAQEVQKNNHQVLVNARLKDVDEYTKALEVARQLTQVSHNDQAKQEKLLFEAQKRLRDAQKKNQVLEQDIRKLEDKLSR